MKRRKWISRLLEREKKKRPLVESSGFGMVRYRKSPESLLRTALTSHLYFRLLFCFSLEKKSLSLTQQSMFVVVISREWNPHRTQGMRGCCSDWIERCRNCSFIKKWVLSFCKNSKYRIWINILSQEKGEPTMWSIENRLKSKLRSREIWVQSL